MTKLDCKDIDRKWKVGEQLRIVACMIVDLSNHELLKRSTHGPERGLIAVVRRRQTTALSKSTNVYACTNFSQVSLSFLLCVVIVDARVTQLGSLLPQIERTRSWFSGYSEPFEMLSH